MPDITEADFEWLRNKVESLTDELRSVERELDRQITDERSDRERADADLDSKIESLRHDVQYGR